MSAIAEGSPRVLFDSGIFIHSEFGVSAVRPKLLNWGDKQIEVPISGVRRKPPHVNPDYQNQINALFTIGRLVRERRVDAVTYNEVRFELLRPNPRPQPTRTRDNRAGLVNAFGKTEIGSVPPALARSKFRSTTSLWDHMAKGGKKDRKAGLPQNEHSQISFLKWLQALTERQVEQLISHASVIGLTEFEVASMRELGWFKNLCQKIRGEENLVDAFTLWTAHRNGCNVVLTLERKLVEQVKSLRREKSNPLELKPCVIGPIQLLEQMGINKPDNVPLEFDRFYEFHELPQ